MTKIILEQNGMNMLMTLISSKLEGQVNAIQHCFQVIINTLSGMDLKEDVKPDKHLIEENKALINMVMKSITYATNLRTVSAIGRDALLELLMKNVDYKSLNWVIPLIDCDGIYRLLEVSSELKEFKYESSMDITDNTRTTVSVTLQKVYDSLACDAHRDLFLEKVDEFVKDKLRGAEIESKVRVTATITALLQGPLEAGNHCIAQQGVLEMMLVMAGSDDHVQQVTLNEIESFHAKRSNLPGLPSPIFLNLLVAAEAIISAASKKDKCKSIVSIGMNILKRLYQSPIDSIRVRALVGLCKIGSMGGHDSSIKPFSDGAQHKLALSCRRFLINPAKDRDIRRWAAEGLSYLTLDAEIKEELVQDPTALQALVELAKTGDMSCLYGVLATLVNLTNSYDKQEVIPELIELAKFAKQHIPTDHEKDAKEYVDKRCKTITEAGITVGLVALSKTEAANSREMISRVFNALCEHQELRGTIVQQGGAKVLIPLALDGTKKGKLAAAQALARIAITMNPEIAFPGQRIVEVVRPLLSLLHMDCCALENFEALMGLCNLAAVGHTVRDRILRENGISNIENYIYEEHVLLKRASFQCMLNMLLSEETIKLFEKENDRVKYWVLVTADEDLETVKAVTGALVMLTGVSKKCCKKIFEPKDWLALLRNLLANEDREIQYRGTCIVYNMMNSTKSIAEKLIETDIMELLMIVSQIEIPEAAKAKAKAQDALKRAEDWKLIKPNTEDDDNDDD